jgi:hypothetical protein
MERPHDGRLPQTRLAVDDLGAHAITIAACGIERAIDTHIAMPSIMARSHPLADIKLSLPI